MASSPHLPQRTPVSSPSRARWKKCCSVIVGSVTAEQAHEDGGGVAAEGVGEADTRVGRLTRARLAAELGDDLRDLRRARRTDRVPFGLEAARRVDGDGAAAARQPAPGSKRPSPSVATISAIVKQSCSSTTSTSAGPSPACLYAAAAARSVAGTRARSRLSPRSIQSDAAAEASTQTPLRWLRATSSDARTTAAPPSVKGQQSRSLSGSATYGLCRTCSTVISFWNCAFGLSAPCLWFFTATAAICASVVPYRCMWARAMSAKTPGKVRPSVCSQLASEA